jgi:uncharacterized protein YjiS (DUF1127 family)
MSCGSINPPSLAPSDRIATGSAPSAELWRLGLPSWRLVIAFVARTCARRRQRRDLLKLSDHLLDDIGITREQAMEEASKPFWR